MTTALRNPDRCYWRDESLSAVFETGAGDLRDATVTVVATRVVPSGQEYPTTAISVAATGDASGRVTVDLTSILSETSTTITGDTPPTGQLAPDRYYWLHADIVQGASSRRAPSKRSARWLIAAQFPDL